MYAVNGVLREQVYELVVYALTAVVLTLYALLNYLDPETPRGAIKLVGAYCDFWHDLHVPKYRTLLRPFLPVRWHLSRIYFTAGLTTRYLA